MHCFRSSAVVSWETDDLRSQAPRSGRICLKEIVFQAGLSNPRRLLVYFINPLLSNRESNNSLCLWVVPLMSSFKFNVDGVVIGGFNRAGIGGILRNLKNVSLLFFSKAVGCLDATLAELLATKEALYLFSNSCCAHNFVLSWRGLVFSASTISIWFIYVWWNHSYELKSKTVIVLPNDRMRNWWLELEGQIGRFFKKILVNG
ncbi:hypothetical protein GQ457_06G017170 [Hibiscus cannabinus]